MPSNSDTFEATRTHTQADKEQDRHTDVRIDDSSAVDLENFFSVKVTRQKIDRSFGTGSREFQPEMDYSSYLNQSGFDPTSCAMAAMDGVGGPGGPAGPQSLSACNLASAYGDLGRCGHQMPSHQAAAAAAAYGAYNTMRPFNPGPPTMPTGSCSMIPRPRDHPQASMFSSGE